MGLKYEYDIWDLESKTKVLSGASANQVRYFLMDSGFNPSKYARLKSVYKQKYLCIISGEQPDANFMEMPNGLSSYQRKSLELLAREWGKAVKPFRNVEWVKEYVEGVKILRVKGRR